MSGNLETKRPCQALLVVEPDHYGCDLPVDHRSRHYDTDAGLSWPNGDGTDDQYMGVRPRVGDRIWVSPPSYAATITSVNPNGTFVVNDYDVTSGASGWVPFKALVRVINRPSQREPDREFSRQVEGRSGRVYRRVIMSDGVDLWDDTHRKYTWQALQEHDGPLYFSIRGEMIPHVSA